MNRVLRSVLLLVAAVVLIATPRARRPEDDATSRVLDAGVGPGTAIDDLSRPCGEAELLVEKELACRSTDESRAACHAMGACCFLAYPIADPVPCQGAAFSVVPPEKNVVCECSCSARYREQQRRRVRDEPPCLAP